MAKFLLSAFADEAGPALADQIAALKDNGISYIEPRGIDGKNIIDLSDDEVENLKRTLDENGIKVGSIGSPLGKFPIDGDFDAYMEKVRRTFAIAKMLDTKYIRMFSFFVKQDELAKYRDEVIRRLRIMVAEAKKAGVVLCHENESEIYGQMPTEVKDILTNVEGLGGIFDAANYRMNNANVMEGIGATLINFKYLHIKDAIYSEQMIVPAGEGEGRIADILEIVNGHTDERVFLTLEPHLKVFAAYNEIDNHKLRGKYTFETNKEAFAFAAEALKKLLIKLGFKKENDGTWQK